MSSISQALAQAKAFRNAGQLREAEQVCRRLLEADAGNAEVHYYLGAALEMQGKLDAAAACYRQSIVLKPDSASAHVSLGDALFQQCQFDEAQSCYRRAVELAPDFAEAYGNLGATLIELNRIDEAEVRLRQAIALKPGLAKAHYNRGMALLTMGRFADGWPEYDWLWQRPGNTWTFRQPRWAGGPLTGKTILLYSDFGQGDALQAVRYADLVKQQGGRVIVECQPSLVQLLCSCPGVDRVIPHGQPVGEFDVQTSLNSLPVIFRATLETIPARVPYLSPQQSLIEQWKREIGRDSGFKIGIAWQGCRTFWRDCNRSIPLSHFSGIARIPGVRLYSLQHGAGREQLAAWAGKFPITDLGDRFHDFHDTAAAMRNLDLVISCDSAPAHLAGALAVPVWMAVAFAPDWRWMLERIDSPWYPTMRLFRQSAPGDWDGVFQRIQQELTMRPNCGRSA